VKEICTLPNILLIEPDLAVLWWFGRILSEGGFFALPATSFLEAERLLNLFDLRIDVVVLDPSMPDSSSFLKNFRLRFVHAKVIALQDQSCEIPQLPQISLFYPKPGRDELTATAQQLEAIEEWTRLIFGILDDPN
jgi:hypothetical protein